MWGTPFVKKLDWTTGLDKYTGRPMDYDPNKDVQKYVPASSSARGGKEGMSCPGNMGGKTGSQQLTILIEKDTIFQ